MATDPILDGNRIRNVLDANIEAAANGDNTIIAAPGAGLRLRLLHFNFTARAAVNARLKSAATSRSGLYNLVAGGSVSFDAPGGIHTKDMATNEAFVINLSAAVGIDGFVLYFVERA